jgi:predicted ATPase
LALGVTLFHLGEYAAARRHLEQGITLYDPQQHRFLAFLYGQDPGVACRLYAAHALWVLGYPDQALKQTDAALSLSQEVSHPYSRALALTFTALLHHFRREARLTYESAEAALSLSTEQGFVLWAALATMEQGWALTAQGQEQEGIARIQRGLTAYQAIGTELARSHRLGILAEAYGSSGQVEAGLRVVAEALALVEKNRERYWEADLQRLQGALLLALSTPHQTEAETCFHKALALARHQQAKSLELRAALPLARLWQQQGKRAAARELLAPVYGWFTEGFDTVDLQEARMLLEDLA